MSLLKKVFNKMKMNGYKFFFKLLYDKKELKKLSKSHIPNAAKLYKAVIETSVKKIYLQENEFIQKIEDVRKNLLSQDEEILVTDYGAHEPDDLQSYEESKNGLKNRATVSDICRIASRPFTWALLLFKIVRHIRPITSLELGTSLGISALYQISAMEINGDGTLFTIEGDEKLFKKSQEHFARFELDSRIRGYKGKFSDVLPDFIKNIENIDYVFIDGHHDEEAVKEYYNIIFPKIREGGVVVLDDIRWSEGMERAWREISNSEHVVLSLDLYHMGVLIISRKNIEKESYKYILE